jgi:hypothetical protein
MNSTTRCAEIARLLDALRSFAQEKEVMARSISFLVLVFTEIKRQENCSPSPCPSILSPLIDEIKLGQIFHRLPSECLDHVRP